MSAPTSNAKFGSRLGFILAAAGSAIGLGNIWRFPYTAGESGGAAFVLVYLFFVLLVGVPVLLAELSLGRKTGSNAVGAFKAIVPDSLWPWVGGLGVLTGFGILAFYSVVAGWTLSYAGRSLTGTFSQAMTADASLDLFVQITGTPGEPILTSGLFLVLTAVIVRGGVSAGIERASKILMPAFFVILVVLAARALTLPGAAQGIDFLFSPDFSKVTPKTAVVAMGQALFSLSLGMGAMITYGGYLQKHENLPIAGVAVAFFDTMIALLAGLIIFPALFSTGAEPAAGGKLVFVVLPTIFDKLPGSTFFALAFYLLLAIAALTSTMSLLEVVVAYFVGERGWSREKTVWLITGGVFLLAIPSALSQGAVPVLSEKGMAEKSFLDLQSIVFGNYTLTVGALLIALFVGWKWGAKQAIAEMGELPAPKIWSFCIRVLCPIAIVVVLVFVFVTGEYF
jgi:neurotransmitter:Na+ symporter, NSS family